MLAALTIAALLIGGLAYNVLHSQARAQRGIEQEFGRRAALAASLTTAALGSTAGQLRETFSGPTDQLATAMRKFSAYNPDTRSAVVDAQGTALATWPVGDPVPDLVGSDAARRALRGQIAISDLRPDASGKRSEVIIATPFGTPFGRRVGVDVVTADTIESFASAYLASAPAIAGGRAYLIDGAGVVVAASGPRANRRLPDRALAAALTRRTSGTYADRYFASAGLTGTSWRVVLSSSRAALFAPVEGSTARTSWLVFIAFVTALLALIAVGLKVQRTSAQLAGSRERERAAQALAHERLHDALTGLPNRALFVDRTNQALALAARHRRPVAVLLVDLDRFKRINDSLGHASGDELIAMVGTRLASTLRPGDTVSRFGGDEFVMLCVDIDGIDAALRIAQRVSESFSEPFKLGAREVHVSCCVGVALHVPGETPADAAGLVRDADAAMYRAKQSGAGCTRIFDADLRGETLRQLDTEVALRAALSADELRVHYQPIVALPDGDLRGVEALVRWERPGVGLVGPLEFIGLAEECGLIGDLGRWVLRAAMADAEAWYREGLIGPDFVLSVNVSAHQFASGELAGVVGALLNDWALRPAQLWLEITETAVARDPEVAVRELASLGALGVRVALDDFGVGHSSLEQLVHSLPVDILKLDRSFSGHLEQSRERAVVAAVAPMAAALQMTVIAEGVESAGQAEALSALGYPLAQGYHFGRPVSPAEMRAALARTTPAPASGSPREQTLTGNY
jgi:diguanylate cyclase (GGDEF)-like protein